MIITYAYIGKLPVCEAFLKRVNLKLLQLSSYKFDSFRFFPIITRSISAEDNN